MIQRQSRRKTKGRRQSKKRKSRLRRSPGIVHKGGYISGGEIPENALVDVKLEPEDPQSPAVLMSYKQAKKEIFRPVHNLNVHVTATDADF